MYKTTHTHKKAERKGAGGGEDPAARERGQRGSPRLAEHPLSPPKKRTNKKGRGWWEEYRNPQSAPPRLQKRKEKKKKKGGGPLKEEARYSARGLDERIGRLGMTILALTREGDEKLMEREREVG